MHFNHIPAQVRPDLGQDKNLELQIPTYENFFVRSIYEINELYQQYPNDLIAVTTNDSWISTRREVILKILKIAESKGYNPADEKDRDLIKQAIFSSLSDMVRDYLKKHPITNNGLPYIPTVEAASHLLTYFKLNLLIYFKAHLGNK